MINIGKGLEISKKFSILLHLPKNCDCTACQETKQELKTQMGDKQFKRACKVLNIV